MARRPTTRFECQDCGASSPGWLGRCPECGAWDSLVEAAAPGYRQRSTEGSETPSLLTLSDITEEQLQRISTGIPVLDRVLGGGLVPGSAVLLAGEPGIGKSTLLLQLADGLGKGGHSVLYLSAEESGRQLRLRADRLRCDPAALRIVADTVVEPLLALLATDGFPVLLVDSVQALRRARPRPRTGIEK